MRRGAAGNKIEINCQVKVPVCLPQSSVVNNSSCSPFNGELIINKVYLCG